MSTRISSESAARRSSRQLEEGIQRELDADLSHTLVEAQLRRKLDLRILPTVILLNMLSFLDRSNIGNAMAAGMGDDLGLWTYDINIAMSIFFFVNLLMQTPSPLFVKKFGFTIVPVSIILLGVITLSTSFVHNRAGFYGARIAVGIVDSVAFPGISYLLTRYYRRAELTLRVGAYMLVSAALAGGFGGLLAAVLLSVPHIGSRTGWQNIFLVEGVITVAFGIVFLFIFPDHPETSTMLTEAERKVALARIRADQPSIIETKEGTTGRLVKRAFLNITALSCSTFFAFANSSVQGLSIFLPTIISLNYPAADSTRIQLLTAPIYICGGSIALLSTWGCIRLRVHWPFVFAGGLALVAGYSIWVATDSSAAQIRYLACFLNLTGGMVVGPVAVGWAGTNASPDTLRAMVGAVVAAGGGIGSFAGVWAYIQTDADTGYRAGNSFNLVAGCCICVGSVAVMLYQKHENRRRENGERDYRLDKPGVEFLGSLHPSFRLIS
ncbi:major facilitator superfamily domain-containing protein [Flagelloscypha sp. PMI_526]|nr:major facilitator superfamily domain-containing protein [Flagelloscypha sp. PMI_526]